VEASAQRMQLVYFSNGATRFREPRRIHDSVLDMECTVKTDVRDVSVVCRPENYDHAFVDYYYTDPTCTTTPIPLVYTLNDHTGHDCLVREPFRFVDLLDAVHHIGPPHPGAVYQQNGALCEVYSLAALYELGERVDDAALPRAVVRRDP
jgi:hypothetical protein